MGGGVYNAYGGRRGMSNDLSKSTEEIPVWNFKGRQLGEETDFQPSVPMEEGLRDFCPCVQDDVLPTWHILPSRCPAATSFPLGASTFKPLYNSPI